MRCISDTVKNSPAGPLALLRYHPTNRVATSSLLLMTERRTVFFVSDGTGITAQMLGHSLLTQFEGVDFNQVTLPFVDSAERAEECLARIEAESASGNGQPIVFSTLVNQRSEERRVGKECSSRESP